MSDRDADARGFRETFFGSLDASYTDGARRELVLSGRQHLLAYLPTPDLNAVPAASSTPGMLAAIDKTHRGRAAVDLYDHAISTPVADRASSEIDAALRRVPLTIVIFPGVFSEFVDTKPFHELFVLPRAAARDVWRAALKDFAVRRSAGEVAETLSDEQFALGRFDAERPRSGFVRRPLEELVVVSSLDDERGELVRAILLVPRRLSLETVDDPSTIATILRRRLTKVFAVLGLPENIVFLGYSMGAPVGLDVLAQAHETGEPWLEHVRAFVAVGGVVFGSHAADDALRPLPGRHGNVAHRQLAALRQLAGNLRVPRGPVFGADGRVATIARNGRAWLEFGAQWADTLEALASAGPRFTIPRLARLGRKVDLRPTVGLLGAVVTEAFQFKSPIWHPAGVGRFRRLVDGALAAVEGLSTDGRLRWWGSATLPTRRVRYYAVTGTLSDGPEGSDARRLGDNDTCYNRGSVDHEFLRHGYRQFVDASGQGLNDSQVAVGRARFWPALSALLNAVYRRDPLDARFLGVLGVDHWGLTLREVNRARDGSVNPFPRLTLFKALAAQVAMDLSM